MATRSFRLSEFSQSAPETNEPVEVLCEDHNGTYLVPYYSGWCNSKWHNCKTVNRLLLRWSGGGNRNLM